MAQSLTSTPHPLAGVGGVLPPVDDTPENRVIWKSTVDRSTIKRLERRAGSEKDRCILTRETTKYVITIAHVIDRERKARERVSLLLTVSS